MKALLVLFLCSVPVQTSRIWTRTSFHRWPRRWEHAQDFCHREHQADLLTVLKPEDLDQQGMTEYLSWVGLHRPHPEYTPDAVFTSAEWQWVDGSNSSWELSAIPDPIQNCAAVTLSGRRLRPTKCDARLFCFCQDSEGNLIFMNKTQSWWKSRDLCSALNLHLATPQNTNSAQNTEDFPVWIGLHHDGQSWRWSNGQHSEYRKWNSGSDPGPKYGADSCVAVSSGSKSMSVQSCSEAFPFLCYKHNMVLVKELLTWEQALETCRNLNPNNHSSFSMVSVEPNELEYALSHAQGATTTKVWVGLRFLGGSWFWTDGGAVSLSLPQCPESELHCGALVLNRTSGPDLIEPSDCSQRFNVLCYREL